MIPFILCLPHDLVPSVPCKNLTLSVPCEPYPFPEDLLSPEHRILPLKIFCPLSILSFRWNSKSIVTWWPSLCKDLIIAVSGGAYPGLDFPNSVHPSPPFPSLSLHSAMVYQRPILYCEGECLVMMTAAQTLICVNQISVTHTHTCTRIHTHMHTHTHTHNTYKCVYVHHTYTHVYTHTYKPSLPCRWIQY